MVDVSSRQGRAGKHGAESRTCLNNRDQDPGTNKREKWVPIDGMGGECRLHAAKGTVLFAFVSLVLKMGLGKQ